jgi:heat shock protein HspQ
MQQNSDDYFPDAPTFAPGQLVCHVRYGYRAVVVDFDLRCMAGDDWYQTNRTQPVRDQPWYHLLVHGSVAITYAAQSSLDFDPAPDPVEHPMVPTFFETFADGRYTRNDEPWPS